MKISKEFINRLNVRRQQQKLREELEKAREEIVNVNLNAPSITAAPVNLYKSNIILICSRQFSLVISYPRSWQDSAKFSSRFSFFS